MAPARWARFWQQQGRAPAASMPVCHAGAAGQAWRALRGETRPARVRMHAHAAGALEFSKTRSSLVGMSLRARRGWGRTGQRLALGAAAACGAAVRATAAGDAANAPLDSAARSRGDQNAGCCIHHVQAATTGLDHAGARSREAGVGGNVACKLWVRWQKEPRMKTPLAVGFRRGVGNSRHCRLLLAASVARPPHFAAGYLE